MKGPKSTLTLCPDFVEHSAQPCEKSVIEAVIETDEEQPNKLTIEA
jgi:hypothetical protein